MREIGFMVTDNRRAATWADLLDAADSTEDVLSVARDFLATFEPSELAALPQPCRPPAAFATAEELVEFAFAVVHHHCGVGSGNDLVARCARFFASAARRIAVLMGKNPRAFAENEDVI